MKQLFIDDYIVQEIDNLARKLHQPAKFRGNAVVRPEYRWENCQIQIRTTPAWVPDEGLFKMIYYASAESLDPEVKLDATGAPSGGQTFACYATSTDGVNWEKPFLGLYDYPALLWNGKPIGTKNNILPSAKGMEHGPIYDPTDPDPEHRYKGLNWRNNADGMALGPMVSADCLRWQFLDVPPLPSADEAHLTYDQANGLFIATVKHNGPYGRSFYLTTSTDLEYWSEQELVFHADQIDQENGVERIERFLIDPAYLRPVYNRPEEYRTDVYNFPLFPYEGLYLGLPVMHHWSGKHPPMYENVDSRKSVELTSSRDLRHWHRVAGRRPFLELSPVGDGSAYDTGQLVTTNGPVVRNNELWFYYLGTRYRNLSLADNLVRRYLDNGAICMAKLRMDGFVSLKGGIEWGSVLTQPLVVEGKELRINVDSWRGQVRAEVVDASDGRPIPGFTREESIPAVIDSIDEPLRWQDKPDLTELVDQTVRIRFSILRGELYAFWFAG